jgi:hypothetical protein
LARRITLRAAAAWFLFCAASNSLVPKSAAAALPPRGGSAASVDCQAADAAAREGSRHALAWTCSGAR